MATIYKRSILKPLPAGAAIIERKGRKFASWSDPTTGKRRSAPLNNGARGKHPPGSMIVVERNTYDVAYIDDQGRRRYRGTGTSDKAAAELIAAKFEAEVALRRRGVIDPKADQYAQAERRPLIKHLDDFHDDLSSRDGDPKHARQTFRYAWKVIKLVGADRLSNLSPSAVQTAIGEIRNDGRSLRTCNAYLQAIKQFGAWLARDGRVPSNQLTHLHRFNAEKDPRRTRRDLSEDEFTRLVDASSGGDDWSWRAGRRRSAPVRNLSGDDRAILYQIAAGTGFRVKELRSLTPESFDLDGDPPTVSVLAAYSKRGRRDVQPIRKGLAEFLRTWLAQRPGKQPVFTLPDGTAKMMRADLDAARATWIDEAPTLADRKQRESSDFLRYQNAAGRYADFHSLRHTYITRVVNSGASVKVAQELARHSTPTLTIGRYAHVRLHDLAPALENLPDPERPNDEHEVVALQRTGTTDDQPIAASAHRA